MTTIQDRALHFRSMNQGIALIAIDLERGLTDPWDFHCECGRAGCAEWVSIGLERFAAITNEQDGFVLAPDHPVPRARRNRQRSAQLLEEAKALCAEAAQQLRRGRKWRRGVRPDA